MSGRTWWFGVVLALSVSSAGCGSDKGGADAGDSSSKKDGGSDSNDGGGAGGSSGKDGGGGAGGTKETTGGTGGDFDSAVLDIDGGIEPCGAVTCIDPECCADPFQSLCGVGAGRACLMPPPEDAEADDRCPSFNIATFSFPSCCTSDGDCGLNVMMFGAGCVELAQFKMFAEQMGAPEDIGIPAPQTCD